MPKVRDVFERAYGPVPDDATCHVGYGYPYEGVVIRPCYDFNGRCSIALGEPWGDFAGGDAVFPDISDRDAEAFRGFFDAAYDAALDALTKEEGPDPRVVIALADAWMVADDAFARERDFRKIEAVYEKVGEAKKRFLEASREFWAALSADGTGESPVLSTHLDVMGEGK